ncbi:MAG TPA: fused MFS/spermidine synthase [Burkholderiaceae bacterium]|nr:fused MFS/spermidine synthase [Burkholderiaceae bacterium]HRZ02108.1 fused MFS/spermidine synthase [Burkholderiaceae bacterium]
MLLFAATILLSSFLLFLVQPIIAKQILPWFGGSSAVWTTCLVFFQVALLAGYAYAHLVSTRLAPRRQAWLHLAVLAASLAFLPIIPSAALKPEGDTDAALRILLLLGLTIGLPYFVLSTTGPLLQSWVAHRLPEKTVYRLFALSNFGSLVGLLAYPFAIEPFLSTPMQSWVWSAGYALFVACCAASAWRARSRGEAPHPLAAAAGHAGSERATAAPAAGPPPRLADYALWLAFSALGSVMLLASTSHITQNVASVPFLWVLPLSLYLFSFVVAFEGRAGRGWYEQRWWIAPTLVALVLMAAALSASKGVLDVAVAVPLYTLGVFLAAVFCNGELARAKPAPRYLTHFYLSLSAGGALGGLFVGLVAPRIFSAFYELPLALVLLAAMAVLVTRGRKVLIGPALVTLAATLWFGAEYVQFMRSDVVYMHRNFYGTLRVREQGAGEWQVRRLLHGVILHGEQPTHEPESGEPGTYYARTSGVGRAIALKQAAGPVRIGVVGLGVGTLAAYGRDGDTLRFYELDPDVLAMARQHFSYLPRSPAAQEFVIGDARLSLERELAAGSAQRYDVLVIDAFSSDSIPVHLITREAIELYARHLAPGGILAVHISNRFLDLEPVLARIGEATGLASRVVHDEPGTAGHAFKTDWVLFAADPATLSAPLLAVSEPAQARDGQSLWTDQFNNLLEVLKSRPLHELRTLLQGG